MHLARIADLESEVKKYRSAWHKVDQERAELVNALKRKTAECQSTTELLQQLLDSRGSAEGSDGSGRIASDGDELKLLRQKNKMLQFQVDELRTQNRQLMAREQQRIHRLSKQLVDIFSSDRFLAFLDPLTRTSFLCSGRTFHLEHRKQLDVTADFVGSGHVLEQKLEQTDQIRWLTKCANIQWQRRHWGLFWDTLQLLSGIKGLEVPLQTTRSAHRHEVYNVVVDPERRVATHHVFDREYKHERLESPVLKNAPGQVRRCPFLWLEGQEVLGGGPIVITVPSSRKQKRKRHWEESVSSSSSSSMALLERELREAHQARLDEGEAELQFL